MNILRWVSLLVVVILGGCCADPVPVDPKRPVELQVTFSDQAGKFSPLAEGAAIPLIRGGQGSQMVSINVRAKNLSACGAQLEGTLIQPDGTASSPVTSNSALEALSDGSLGIPDGNPMAAVPLPMNSPTPGVWSVKATVISGAGVRTDATHTFMVGCAPSDTYCRCQFLHEDAGCN